MPQPTTPTPNHYQTHDDSGTQVTQLTGTTTLTGSAANGQVTATAHTVSSTSLSGSDAQSSYSQVTTDTSAEVVAVDSASDAADTETSSDDPSTTTTGNQTGAFAAAQAAATATSNTDDTDNSGDDTTTTTSGAQTGASAATPSTASAESENGAAQGPGPTNSAPASPPLEVKVSFDPQHIPAARVNAMVAEGDAVEINQNGATYVWIVDPSPDGSYVYFLLKGQNPGGMGGLIWNTPPGFSAPGPFFYTLVMTGSIPPPPTNPGANSYFVALAGYRSAATGSQYIGVYLSNLTVGKAQANQAILEFAFSMIPGVAAGEAAMEGNYVGATFAFAADTMDVFTMMGLVGKLARAGKFAAGLSSRAYLEGIGFEVRAANGSRGFVGERTLRLMGVTKQQLADVADRFAVQRFRSVSGIERFDRLATEYPAELQAFIQEMEAQGWIVKPSTKLAPDTPAYFLPRKKRFYYGPERMTYLDMLHEQKHLERFTARGNIKPGKKGVILFQDEIAAYSYELDLLRREGGANPAYIQYLEDQIALYRALLQGQSASPLRPPVMPDPFFP